MLVTHTLASAATAVGSSDPVTPHAPNGASMEAVVSVECNASCQWRIDKQLSSGTAVVLVPTHTGPGTVATLCCRGMVFVIVANASSDPATCEIDHQGS